MCGYRERLDEIIGKKLKIENIDATSKLHMQQIMGRRHIILEPSCPKLNTIIPCAACKLLRRKCAEECPFSPYFSPHEPQKFAAVHKVFGASNVSKLLMVSYIVLRLQYLDLMSSELKKKEF